MGKSLLVGAKSQQIEAYEDAEGRGCQSSGIELGGSVGTLSFSRLEQRTGSFPHLPKYPTFQTISFACRALDKEQGLIKG